MRMTEPLLLSGSGHAATAKALRGARIGLFAEWYLALSYLVSAAVGLGVVVALWLTLGLAAVYVETTWARAAVAFGGGALSFLVTRVGFLAYPRLRAQSRAKRIDQDLPSIITLSYALARGNMHPLEIFRTVSAEKEAYGEAAVEFGVIVRNVEWMGMDLITALEDARDSTPSQKLKPMLDGLITILNSGAEPKEYFRHQADNQFTHSEQALQGELEQASMLAEIYVSGLLVLPLLLLVVLSGLAPLAPGQDALMPFVVFAMIPLGTLVYIIMLETMLPAESLAVPRTDPLPLNDFGLDSVPRNTPLLPPPWEAQGNQIAAAGGDPDAARAIERTGKALRRAIFFDRLGMKLRANTKAFIAHMLARPTDAAQYSAILGIAVAAGMMGGAWANGYRGGEFQTAVTGALLIGAAFIAVPISVFHEIRVHRARKIEESIPETLGKLSGFNERGISLLQSFHLLGRSATGPLAKQLKAVEADVAWNGSVPGALRRLRQRVNTLQMTKLGILLERASAATGHLREVLEVATRDATKSESLRGQKHQAMLSYVVVIYIVFAVFIYVLFVVARLFYGPTGLSAAAASSGLSQGIDPQAARLLFAQGGVIQGLCCGLIAGRLGEGHLLSGLKHAVIMGLIAFLVFYLGVL